ncbi:glycosyltransferase family 2 protein [Aliivibrio fischeri]|uniref:glycosyltransferase family 2 protein n=1 Tax=Aliivibrio fischeri TaxID=668 RepID=UPI0007C44353|nr:glycosyltransferase family 2 protein [Aliivibrio fischeri]
MNDKISIIIPVYNLEKYVEDCIKSILKQSHKNFEAIFIDDGSIDNSAKIIEKYTYIDNRIILKSIENGGVTNARHRGVELSSGRYILFVDGDDILLSSSLNNLLQGFNDESVDIVVSGYRALSESLDDLSIVEYKPELLNSYQYIEFLLSDGNQGTPWGKLFKSDVLSREAFNISREINVREDAIMNVVIAAKSHSINIIREPTYGYRIRCDSAVAQKHELKYYINYYFILKNILHEHDIVSNNVNLKFNRYCLLICLSVFISDLKKLSLDKISIKTLLTLVNNNNVNWSIKEKIKINIMKLTCFFFK